MFCSNCGQELAPEAKFCSNCGAPVESGASSVNTPKGSSPSGSDRDWGGYSTDGDETRNESPVSPPPPAPSDQPFAGDGFSDRKPDWEVERERLRDSADDEWAMSDLGPPRRRTRRTWLWVLLGMIALAVIACCVFFFWILGTDSGSNWFEGIATQAAEDLLRATEEAATPVP